MKPPIKPGERVSAEYDRGRFGFTKIKGTFSRYSENGKAEIDVDGRPHSAVPSSMRRLVKRKYTRRRFWINVYSKGYFATVHDTEDQANTSALNDRISCVEVVEVRKKKI